jgi:hypothetical protein
MELTGCLVLLLIGVIIRLALQLWVAETAMHKLSESIVEAAPRNGSASCAAQILLLVGLVIAAAWILSFVAQVTGQPQAWAGAP